MQPYERNQLKRIREQAARYQENYPPGTRVFLHKMNDPHSPVQSGTCGTVDHVDSMGQIHMKWDNSRILALVPGVDSFRKLTAEEVENELREHSD